MSFSLHIQLEKDTFVIGDFRLSRLLLMNESRYPWFILVPRIEGLRELFELGREEQISYILESNLLAKMLKDVFKAEKLNIAALGNQVEQLHIHHIGRFKADACWPRPVWGVHPPKAYEPDVLLTMKENVRTYFGTKLKAIDQVLQ